MWRGMTSEVPGTNSLPEKTGLNADLWWTRPSVSMFRVESKRVNVMKESRIQNVQGQLLLNKKCKSVKCNLFKSLVRIY